jgi:hypothetical protein
MGITRPWISSAITRFGVDSFGHLLVFAACHWLHPAAAAAGCRAAARERQGDHESQTKADFSEEVVFRFHNCGFRLFYWFYCLCCIEQTRDAGFDSAGIPGSRDFILFFAGRFVRSWRPGDSMFEKSVSPRSAQVPIFRLRRRGRLRYGV